MASNPVRIVLCLIGGVVGGVIGYYGFFWIMRQGFYALPLPGALIGAGCGLFAASRSTIRGLVCALAGLGLGLFTEWKAFPFRADDSLGYFLSHFYQLKPVTLLLVAAGALAAYWFGGDAFGGPWSDRKPAPATRREGDGV